MILYFANRELEILGTASTSLPRGLIIVDDEKVEDIDTGVATFTATLSFTSQNRLSVEQMTQEGNYVLRSDGHDAECYTIITATTSAKNKERLIECEDAGLDLLNEIAPAYTATTAMTIAQYIEMFAGDAGFEIGVNELSHLTRTLSWDAESTVTERIRSVATQFDGAEISYSFEIQNLNITGMFINVWKARGTDIEEQLRLDRDIDDIRVISTVESLVTGLKVIGGTPDGQDTPITLRGYSYDDGDIYVDSNGRLLSREAAGRWSRIGGESYIIGQFTYETTNRGELFTRAYNYLTQYRNPLYNYEIDVVRGLENCHIGDRVNVVDDLGEVYVSARILQLSTSVTNGTKSATLGDFLIRDSGMSQKVLELASQFETLAANRNLYTWFAYADDDQGTGISLSPSGKTYMGTATLRSTPTVDISDPSIFTWVSLGGGEATDFYNLTITSSAGTVFLDTLVTTTLTATVILNEYEMAQADLTANNLEVNWYNVTTGVKLGTGLTYSVVNATSLNVTAKLETTGA